MYIYLISTIFLEYHQYFWYIVNMAISLYLQNLHRFSQTHWLKDKGFLDYWVVPILEVASENISPPPPLKKCFGLETYQFFALFFKHVLSSKFVSMSPNDEDWWRFLVPSFHLGVFSCIGENRTHPKIQILHWSHLIQILSLKKVIKKNNNKSEHIYLNQHKCTGCNTLILLIVMRVLNGIKRYLLPITKSHGTR